VRKSWGPEVVSLSQRDFNERVAAAQADAALGKDLLARAGKSEVSEAEVLKASGVYRVLESLVAEHRLWALTVRCFDLVSQQRTTGCLALSKLADDGVPAGCEGDVPAAVRSCGCTC
jgi:L-fucose isomerase-like protein